MDGGRLMDGKDANRFMMAGKPDMMGGLPNGAGLMPAQQSTREGTLARGAAALVFGLSAMAAAAAVLVSPRLVDTLEHAARARPVTTARPRLDTAVPPAPAVASVPPQPIEALPLAPEPSASRSLLAEGPATEPVTAPATATAPVLAEPEAPPADDAPRGQPVPEAPSAADTSPTPDPAVTDPVPAAALNPYPVPPAAPVPSTEVSSPRVELGAAPALPEPPLPISQPPILEQPPASAAVEPAALPDREQATVAIEPPRQPVGTAAPGAMGGTEPPDAVQMPEPAPTAPSAMAGMAVPEPPVALPRQAPASPPPGLLLVARPGDTLQRLYKSVYSGVRPPRFQDIVDANPSPVRPGVVLVFPTPPDGWRRPGN